MAGLILSPLPKIKHPYYASSLGLHLYSAEELCYYIFNNIMLIDSSFIDERLLDFLSKCGYAGTAMKISKWKESADFFELLIVILQDVNYYNAQEIEEFRENCLRIAREGYEAILHEKGDYLVELGKYYDAIAIYDKLLSTNSEYMSKKMQAKVHFSKGVALARLFVYKDAMDEFMKAYELTGADNYIKHVYRVHLMAPRIPYDEELLSKVGAEKLGAWKKEYDEIRKDANYSVVMYGINELKEKDERKRQAGFLDLIAEWRSDYKRSQS